MTDSDIEYVCSRCGGKQEYPSQRCNFCYKYQGADLSGWKIMKKQVVMVCQ